MDPKTTRAIVKSKRVILMVVLVSASLLLIFNAIPVNSDQAIGPGNGLDYGMDFAGGVQMQLKLERKVSKEVMEIEKGILLNRLNAMGLKDISVRPWGDQYILVEISSASPEEIDRIEEILKQPARFEERIDGKLAVKGDEIQVNADPQASGVMKQSNGFGWRVGVKLDNEGAERFGKAAEGKYYGPDSPMNRPVDLFIDRPKDSLIVFDQYTHALLQNVTSSDTGTSSIYYGDSALEVIEKRANLTVLSYEGNESRFSGKIDNYTQYRDVILAGNEKELPNSLRAQAESIGFDTQRIPKSNLSYEDWVKEISGLKTSPRLNFNTNGEPVYEAVISGWRPTREASKEEMKQTKIWLSSGNLPAKAHIISESKVPASLGERFLGGSFYIGMIAILTVAIIIFLRYRKLFIVGPVMVTGMSEILLILGLAAIINWELDLAAVAGIIAAVGTGVDDQILITDETIRREKGEGKGKKKKVIVRVAEKIKRAFFIIFTAAATTIAVMLPVFTIQALQGFAFTTVVGVLMGVFITRRAYAKIIEEMLSE